MSETFYVVDEAQHHALVKAAYAHRGYSDSESEAAARFCDMASTYGIRTHNAIKALHLDEADYFNRMILWDVVPRRHMYKQLLDDIKQDFAARQSDLSN